MSTGGDKSTPYTEKEKLLLASLVDAHKLLENKRTDATTVQLKQQEWETLAQDYKIQIRSISTRRTARQLKKLWSNLKQRKRKATTQLKYCRLLTGGGPEPIENLDPVMEAVDAAAPHADYTLECPWDTTAEFEESAGLSSQTASTSRVTMKSLDLERNIEVDVLSPSTSVNPTSIVASTPSTKYRKMKAATNTALQSEANLRVRKIDDSITQQLEIHDIRVSIEMEQLETVRANRRKSEAEAELAELQLEFYKKSLNLYLYFFY